MERATSDSKISVVEFEHRAGWRGTLWYAVVWVGPSTLCFSRYDDEDEWYCDAHFGAGGYPHFCHGEGGRGCLKQVATGELKALLDAQMKERGDAPVVERYGQRKVGQ